MLIENLQERMYIGQHICQSGIPYFKQCRKHPSPAEEIPAERKGQKEFIGEAISQQGPDIFVQGIDW